ncbi:MAG TPA: hypothetical protein VJU86_10965 [Pyrinomonadaceae bacterium]|nr:hypothetical protein [Pyrinomonadaceae bacterium]
MNRNQKIALGCGGGGCLGIILLVILGAVLVVTGVIRAPGLYNPSSNSNDNSNRNSNYNSPYNRNSNTNSNTNTSSSSSTMSEDAKHRLYQAAGVTQDTELILRVLRKIGLGDGEGDDHKVVFVEAHKKWAKTNTRFIVSVLTPEKARAYVMEHIDD